MATGVLAIRTTVWDGLSDVQRTWLNRVSGHLTIGVPALWDGQGQTQWYVWSDSRWTMTQWALWACVLENIDDIPPGYQIPMIQDEEGNDVAPNYDAMRVDVIGFAEDPGRQSALVYPEDVPGLADSDQPWVPIFAANGVQPTQARFFQEFPQGWSPVGVTP